MLESGRSGALSLSHCHWQSYKHLHVRIHCSYGSHVDVCWWDIKALLPPERPPNDVFRTMSAEQQLWPEAPARGTVTLGCTCFVLGLVCGRAGRTALLQGHAHDLCWGPCRRATLCA